ncbi:MAG: hypothetical protein HKN33_14030 [Pyrinomonadaceae bacterium]|nr:hypothetical protein [Pyrinomonadaceae bacterium]
MSRVKTAFSVILSCLFVVTGVSGQDPAPTDSLILPLMDTEITVNKYQHTEDKKSGLIFIVLHHNEQTGLRVTKQIVKERGGVLYEVVSTRNGRPVRDLYFKHNGSEYAIDPNRLFTSAGITKNLRKRHCFEVLTEGDATTTSCSWDRPRFEEFENLVPGVQRFAESILKLIKPVKDGAIVSVHNNSNYGFSLNSYTHGGAEWRSSERGIFFGKEDVDNFFLVTNEELFNRLYGKDPSTWDFNIVLQKKPPNPDDGSLSIYSGRVGLNYILIEAESNSGAVRQVQMINRVIDAFRSRDSGSQD